MRSEDWIPADIRRILSHPRFSHLVACACLLLLVLACFWGIRVMANRRLEPLFVGQLLNRHDLIEVERAFLREKLSGYKIENGQVLVPVGLRSRYCEALAEQEAFPKDPGDFGIDAINRTTVLESSEQRRRRSWLANEQAISLILRGFAGIDDAAVHYDATISGGLHPTKEMTALVTIQPSAGTVIDRRMMASIRNTVTAYKAGLDPADVTIVNQFTAEIGVVSVDDAAQAYEARQATLERSWQTNVARVLRFIPGVEIETNVDLRTNREPPLSDSVHPLEPSRIVVAISVPIGYYRELWNQRTTDANAKANGPTSEELVEIERETHSKIKSLVSNLASGHTEQEKPEIQVALFRQVDKNADEVATSNGPFLAWIHGHLNQIVQATVVLLAIGLVVGVFRDLFYEDVLSEERPPPNVERPAQDLRVYTPVDKKQSAVVESETQDTSPEQRDTFVNADLTELVREHPQAASAMLKSWVKEAS